MACHARVPVSTPHPETSALVANSAGSARAETATAARTPARSARTRSAQTGSPSAAPGAQATLATPAEPAQLVGPAEPAEAVEIARRAEPVLTDAPASKESHLIALPVPGFQSAVLAVPVADGPLRLMVAAHGAGGDPDSTCSAWAQRTHGHVLVACPRGHAMNALEPHGYYYPDHHTLEAEVLAVVAATARRYGTRLVETDAIYSGFSQGATMGALFIPARAAFFSTLVLTEGGYTEWTLQRAHAFRAAGGSRALFVCGTRHCATRAEQSSKLLARAGVATRVEHVLGGGHTDRSRVGERLNTLSDWALSPQP